MPKIVISFKDQEKDLYDFLKSQLSPSIYVKEMLKDKMKDNNNDDNGPVNFNF